MLRPSIPWLRHTVSRCLSTTTRFNDATSISQITRAGLHDMFGVDATMTDIQEQTLTPGLNGDDILARARTGTGKTVAFLVPALQNLQGNRNSGVELLIVSPTRELATQISQQCIKMLKHHPNKPQVQTLFGGTMKPKKDSQLFQKNAPSILVATPGRLMSHLNEKTLGNDGVPLSTLQTLVLDEADQLLDQGFRKEIMELIDITKRQKKQGGQQQKQQAIQTLLFSATMPPALREVMSKAMRPDYITVDCIGNSQSNQGNTNQGDQTHSATQVQQHLITADTNGSMIQTSLDVLRTVLKNSETEEKPVKIIAFLPTAALTKFYASVWSQCNENGLHPLAKKNAQDWRCYEMHSRKSQSKRTKISSEFSKCTSGIMFSSDVSARGVDYPGVTHVIQIGSPSSVEQYIHRLGRTGRAGQDGIGILILTPFEHVFSVQLERDGIDLITHDVSKNVPLKNVSPNVSQQYYASSSAEEKKKLLKMLTLDAENTLNHRGINNYFEAGKAYQSSLGHLLGTKTPKGYERPSKEEFVLYANEFAKSAGYNFGVMPELMAKTVGKMGLKDVNGKNMGAKRTMLLNVVKGEQMVKKQQSSAKGRMNKKKNMRQRKKGVFN